MLSDGLYLLLNEYGESKRDHWKLKSPGHEAGALVLELFHSSLDIGSVHRQKGVRINLSVQSSCWIDGTCIQTCPYARPYYFFLTIARRCRGNSEWALHLFHTWWNMYIISGKPDFDLSYNTVFILKNSSPRSLEVNEHLFIQKLRTLKPYGINSCDPLSMPLLFINKSFDILIHYILVIFLVLGCRD
jgi:hypothetical protein